MQSVRKVLLIVLDGMGVGEQADAGRYGDQGADTFGHVYKKHSPSLPNLEELGLLRAAGIPSSEGDEPIGCYGRMRECAAGKDTTSGHWEIAGLTLREPLPTYPNGFPPEVIEAFERETGLHVIGNRPASGTAIIQELGDEHVATGDPIVYTSADSVFQIAAHESVIQLQELYHICRVARKILKGRHAVGRVIARPFAGESGRYYRTDNRRDFSLDPVGPTMLDMLKEHGYSVTGIGKIEDIFNNRGLTSSDHAHGNAECVDALLNALETDRRRGLVFANLVDTDQLYGHRRDSAGYARCLEEFDRRLPEILRALGDDGMLIVTADHGCDPTFTRHTDHTREEVPLLAWGLMLGEGTDIGTRSTFADVSATVLDAFGLRNPLDGTSFLPLIRA